MTLLIILASFGMFTVILLIGVAIGYALGHKNDQTLRQQIGKLKTTIKKQNESKQLRELTTAELKQRDDWDFRSRLAEVTGVPLVQPDAPMSDDPASMDRTF